MGLEQQLARSDASCAFQLSPFDGPEGDSVDPLSSSSSNGQTDAQVLARMLQEQLDAINNEIRSRLELRTCCSVELCGTQVPRMTSFLIALL